MAVQTLGYDDLGDAPSVLVATQATYACYLYVEQPDYAAGVASAPSDEVAPTATAVTSTSAALSRSDEIVIDVDDDAAIGYAGVFVSINGAPKQAVFRRGAFESGFAALSSIESLNAGKKQRLHIRPDTRWPAGASIAITVDSIDTAGNLGA